MIYIHITWRHWAFIFSNLSIYKSASLYLCLDTDFPYNDCIGGILELSSGDSLLMFFNSILLFLQHEELVWLSGVLDMGNWMGCQLTLHLLKVMKKKKYYPHHTPVIVVPQWREGVCRMYPLLLYRSHRWRLPPRNLEILRETLHGSTTWV